MKKKESTEVEICEKCKIKMEIVGIEDSGEFSINQIIYKCPKCHVPKTVEFL